MLSRNPTHRPNNVAAFAVRGTSMLRASRSTVPAGLPAKANVLVNP